MPMTEKTQDTTNTRLVNVDMLSTQELKAQELQNKPDTSQTQLQKTLPPAYGPVTQAQRLFEWGVRFFVTVFAATTLFSLVTLPLLTWVVPPWYRDLTPRQQVIWCNRVSALCDLQNSAPEDGLLAIDNSNVDSDAALSLLDAPTATLEPITTLAPTEVSVLVSPTLSSKGGTNLNGNTVETNTLPSPTEQAPAPPTPTPQPTIIPVRGNARLDINRLAWEEQGWNNCGPTTITIGLSYFGYNYDQEKAVEYLKPNIEDKNVSPSEMVLFVNTQAVQDTSVHALYRLGGTPDLLKALIDAGFPVIIERGIDVAGSGWMGHYSLVVGYDDTAGDYLLFDSYFGDGDGDGRRESQVIINQGWKHFNHTFVVIYDPNREANLNAVLGNYIDSSYAATKAFENAKVEATLDPDDKWAWFNMGTALVQLGRYEEAVLAFDRVRTLQLPFRMLWYQFAPYEAYYHVGRYDDVLALALANERQTEYVEEIYYYRGLSYAAQGNVDEAIREFDKALVYNSNYTQAHNAKQAVLEGRFVAPA